MTLKVKMQERPVELVGKGTIDGTIPFYFKDQGHRWMVRIGDQWTFKQHEAIRPTLASETSARHKMYWAIAQFRSQSRHEVVS
ncbi:hypothetical protein [Yoonia sp.]|uniref:hypothetical protein n=1 Tax=Yoonia sp. TaxID=2212373 RepID=UPI00391D182D